MNFVNALNALHIVVWAVLMFMVLVRILTIMAAAKYLPNVDSLSLVAKLNGVHSNVWAVAILAAGVALMCCGKEGAGGTVVAIASTLLRTSGETPSPLAVNPAPKS